MLTGYQTEILNQAGVLAIVAIGLYLAIRAGQLSIGHAAIAGAGSYAAGLLARDLGVPIWFSILGGAAVAAIVAAGVSLFSLRLDRFFFAIATLAFGEALVVVLENVDAVGGSGGLSRVPIAVSTMEIYGVLAVVLLAMLRLHDSRMGQALRAVAGDPEAAAASGIDVARTKIVGFTISGFVAGLGGGLYVFLIGFVEPSHLGFGPSVEVLIFVIVGGAATVWGPVLGAFSLSILPEVLRFTIDFRAILQNAGLLLIVLWKPSGLLGRRRIGEPGRLRWVRGRWRRLRGHREARDASAPTEDETDDVAAPTTATLTDQS